MENQSEIVKIFTGSEVTVGLLKAELEKVGVVPMIKDDFAADLGGSPFTIDLFISQEDLLIAKPVIEGFLTVNK